MLIPKKSKDKIENKVFEDTLIVVLSKTGGTAETIACLAVLISHYKGKEIGDKSF